MQKNIVVFVRDHSGSMRSIAEAARRDFNETAGVLKEVTLAEGQDTIVSVVKCGHGNSAIVHREIIHSSVAALKPIPDRGYKADAGGTPLFESIREAIKVAQEHPDYNNPDVSVLINVTTDGQETQNRNDGPAVGRLIRELQATDRWTFTFRVPRGDARALVALGIPAGNIMEWEQSERGMAMAAAQSKEAFTEYAKGRSTGQRASQSFYANLANVTSEEVKAALVDISTKVALLPVAESEHEMQIRDFVEKRTGKALLKGAAFYQLTKSEDKVQASKKICIRDKKSNAIYYGEAARQMLSLPQYSDVRLKPDDLGNFDVFIQSTSVNRKVQKGSQILLWEDVGVAYKEGPSAR